MEARGQSSHLPLSSFSKGDRLIVLHEEDEWLWCLREGVHRVGFVARVMVEETGREISEREAITRCQLPPHLQRSHWLHGRISRTEAQDLLDAEQKVREESGRRSGAIRLNMRILDWRLPYSREQQPDW